MSAPATPSTAAMLAQVAAPSSIPSSPAGHEIKESKEGKEVKAVAPLTPDEAKRLQAIGIDLSGTVTPLNIFNIVSTLAALAMQASDKRFGGKQSFSRAEEYQYFVIAQIIVTNCLQSVGPWNIGQLNNYIVEQLRQQSFPFGRVEGIVEAKVDNEVGFSGMTLFKVGSNAELVQFGRQWSEQILAAQRSGYCPAFISRDYIDCILAYLKGVLGFAADNIRVIVEEDLMSAKDLEDNHRICMATLHGVHAKLAEAKALGECGEKVFADFMREQSEKREKFYQQFAGKILVFSVSKDASKGDAMEALAKLLRISPDQMLLLDDQRVNIVSATEHGARAFEVAERNTPSLLTWLGGLPQCSSRPAFDSTAIQEWKGYHGGMISSTGLARQESVLSAIESNGGAYALYASFRCLFPESGAALLRSGDNLSRVFKSMHVNMYADEQKSAHAAIVSAEEAAKLVPTFGSLGSNAMTMFGGGPALPPAAPRKGSGDEISFKLTSGSAASAAASVESKAKASLVNSSLLAAIPVLNLSRVAAMTTPGNEQALPPATPRRGSGDGFSFTLNLAKN
ncbi:MAG: HAD family hydrolase [Gammaproteobacteria bacterium]|nr:HAD family hydrolase [Gammaproteobacteria bacterium]